jgi:hypothetical protein
MAHRVRTPESPVFRLQNLLLLDAGAAWLPRRCRRGAPLEEEEEEEEEEEGHL